MSSLTSAIATRLLGFRGYDSRGLYRWTWDERRTDYAYADGLYDNAIYGDLTDSAYQRDLFKRVSGRARKSRQEMLGHINPIAGIVDVYRNCVGGRFGSELRIELDGQDVPKPLQKAIANIWRDSRLDIETEPLQYFGANYGPAFLRIYADAVTKKVRVVPVHPGDVIDFETNEAGSIVSVLIEYEQLEGELGEERTSVAYRERLTKETFERWEVDNEKKTKVTIPNALGICPVVLIRHSNKGRKHGKRGDLGLSAWNGSDDIIHLINIRLSQLGLSIDKALWAKWFIAAAGDQPTSMDLGGEKIITVKLNQGDAAPQMKAIVEPIDPQSALKSIDVMMTSLIGRQPEMVLDHLEALAGQSGETIRKLLTRVSTRIIDARTKYEDGLCDALRQAMSWRILFGLEPSFGMATREAADNAYRNGSLDFHFTKRPALPPTSDEMIVDAKAQYAERKEAFAAASASAPFVSLPDQIRIAGYTDKEADELAVKKFKETLDAEKRQADLNKPTVP